MLRMGHLDEARQADALEVVERNARVQVRLIEDLLDVSRIITGKLRLELRPVPLAPALDEAANTVRPVGRGQGREARLRVGRRGRAGGGAPERLQQVLWNLLSNAIKFTPRGGSRPVPGRAGDGTMRIVVADTGVGIKREFLPHVFERFRQADSSTTRAHSGVGLGLAIVRHLVELHGGTIEAASDGRGRGATFTVTLRRHTAAPLPHDADAVRRRQPPTTSAGVRVLVVDDEADARGVAAAVLERARRGRAPPRPCARRWPSSSARRRRRGGRHRHARRRRLRAARRGRRQRAALRSSRSRRTPVIALTRHGYAEARRAERPPSKADLRPHGFQAECYLDTG
jgi:hypothetical protein